MSNVTPDTNLLIFQPNLDTSTATDPLYDDTDNDGLLDGEENTNRNGWVDPGEMDLNDNPSAIDVIVLPGLMLLLFEE